MYRKVSITVEELELIVTQWDVNVTGCIIDSVVANELIVTQWDVNEIITAQCDTKGKGINSYIVGCKC